MAESDWIENRRAAKLGCALFAQALVLGPLGLFGGAAQVLIGGYFLTGWLMTEEDPEELTPEEVEPTLALPSEEKPADLRPVVMAPARMPLRRRLASALLTPGFYWRLVGIAPVMAGANVFALIAASNLTPWLIKSESLEGYFYAIVVCAGGIPVAFVLGCVVSVGRMIYPKK